MRAKILLIDPDEKEINSFQHILETEGHRTRKAHSVEAGLRLCEDDNFDLIFISSNLKDVVINDLIRKLRQLNPDTEFIIITNLSQLQSLAS
ncbi:MAG: response regulator, partial [candidate division WOR-3 bacterium]